MSAAVAFTSALDMALFPVMPCSLDTNSIKDGSMSTRAGLRLSIKDCPPSLTYLSTRNALAFSITA